MSKIAWNRITWTEEMLGFLRENWASKTNRELAECLGLRLTSVRTKMYEMGLKRMEMEYWTEEQVAYLKQNYKKMGDTELAEYFNKTWKKEKGWSKKHIEKKRRCLKLKRTEVAIKVVHKRNKASGRLAVANRKRWEKTGVTTDGTVRYWKNSLGVPMPMIKVNGRWEKWARVMWERNFGVIPPGMNVVFVNGDSMDLRVENLELLTDGELSAKTATRVSMALSDSYVVGMLRLPEADKQRMLEMPEAIELRRNLLKFKRIIKDERKRVGNERH
jgi:hypothetical protein